MNPQEFLGLVRQGKHEVAIGYLYRNFQRVRVWIIQNNGSSAEAKDTFQEGILVFLKKALDPDFKLVCKPSTYLFSVCKHIWMATLRQKQKTEAQLEDMEVGAAELSEVEELWRRERHFAALDSALQKIGENCRKLLTMFYLEKKSMEHIAAVFGFSGERSAKTQKYKCLQKARTIATRELQVQTQETYLS